MKEPCTKCVNGFISLEYKSVTTKKTREGNVINIENVYDGVAFCPTCEPERAQIQQSSKSNEEYWQRLRTRSQYKVAENYDLNEASKTRTL